MTVHRTIRQFFEIPHAAVYALMPLGPGGWVSAAILL
jgi:hypothetical protein